MIKYIGAILALAFALTACTPSTPDKPAPSVGCTIESAVSGVVSLTIASQLQCSNQAAIQASIAAAASKAGICTAPAALAIGKPKPVQPVLKSISSDICTTVAETALSSLVSGAIPAAWGCTAASATTSLQTLIAGACVKAFP